jgi:hypothetical protein
MATENAIFISYLPFQSTKKYTPFTMAMPASYMHIASDMQPAALKTTNTYQDLSVM